MFKSDRDGVVLLGVPKNNGNAMKEKEDMSFLGGRPRWYGSCTNFKEETLNRTLKCAKCRRPLMFLCQMYAPTDDLIRHLLIYGCNSGQCENVPGSFRVLRIQNTYLEAHNDVKEESSKESNSTGMSASSSSWAIEGADDWNNDGINEWGNDADEDPSEWDTTTTTTPLPKTPVAASTENGEKDEIKIDSPSPPMPPPKSFMNPQCFSFCELETIQEPYESAENDSETLSVSAAAAAMEALKLDVRESVASGETYESVPQDKKTFLRFRRRISRCPSQCFRYAYGGEPLWDNFIADRENIPDCNGCGAKRVFEAQLTPQVLHCLHVDDFVNQTDASSLSHSNVLAVKCADSGVDDIPKNKTATRLADVSLCGMDWGGLYIYACPNSCNESCEEYVYVSTTDEKKT